MDCAEYEKPRLVPTGRGFSVLYRNKYLYSKYDPQRAVTAQADALRIPEESVLLCFSPLLGYGLKELIEKLPSSSYILAVECDQALMRFSLDNCDAELFSHPRFSYIRADTVPSVIKKIESLSLFPFKSCLTLICSGGVQLYRAFYDQVRQYAEEFIARFWINRLTLMHLGRNYAHNTFRNLLLLQEGTDYTLLRGTERITKPVLVAGAGTSLDESRDFIIRNRSRFFLLAVDAAAAALMPEIRPDAVVLVESQYWIDSSFIGCKKSGIPIFADLTASPRAVRSAGGKVYFFCTDYARLRYLQCLYQLLQPLVLPPMGSVGLTALRLALNLCEPEFPVFHTGLDFAWGKGFTHAKESSPVKKLYAETSRTESLYKLSIPAALQHGSGKQGLPYLTSPVLAGYAGLYRHTFIGNARIFDIGTFGCCLTERQLDHTAAEQLLDDITHSTHRCADCVTDFSAPLCTASAQSRSGCIDAIRRYLCAEYEQLAALNAHLQGRKTLPQDMMERIIAERDYLYGHFPDAARGYALDTGFLKRLRIEITYLLKILS